MVRLFGASMVSSSNSVFTPLGRPVVPEEYSMSRPADSSAIRDTGCASRAASHEGYPGSAPPTQYRARTPGLRSSNAAASPARPAETMKSFAPQSARMYSASCVDRRELMAVKSRPARCAAKQISK